MNESTNQLKALVERIERVSDEKDALSADIREIYAEAKANGFDTKALRAVIRRRKLGRPAVESFDSVVETYEGNLV